MFIFVLELDADGEPSVHSIIQKWRKQWRQDADRNELEERVFNAEDHFQRMCQAGAVTDQNAESFWRRIKNARAESVSLKFDNPMFLTLLLTLVLGDLAYARGPWYVFSSKLEIRNWSALSLIWHRGYIWHARRRCAAVAVALARDEETQGSRVLEGSRG